MTTDPKDVLRTLKSMSSKSVRDGMARFAIPADYALGIPVGEIRRLGKELRGRGRDEESQASNHKLALALWELERPHGVYEARMLACFVDEPSLVTPAQMDRWARDFDNWAICDTACFHLFDRTPHAMKKVAQWAKSRDEFVKRAAFALLASLGGHDKTMADDEFFACLPLIEGAAGDDRNFVNKGVSWALRSVGRRSAALHRACLELAAKLSASDSRAARWIGHDAKRDLAKANVKGVFAKSVKVSKATATKASPKKPVKAPMKKLAKAATKKTGKEAAPRAAARAKSRAKRARQV